MRVIVPVVPGMLHPSVVPAIVAAGYRPEVHLVDGDDQAYWRLLRGAWSARVDFCVVEQDNEVAKDTLASLEACPKLWCACSYDTYWGDIRQFYGPDAASLGCTRFRAHLMEAVPELFDELPQTDPDHFAPRHWGNLDTNIWKVLRTPRPTTPVGVAAGPEHWRAFEVCGDHPRVIHHHAYDYEGGWVHPDIRERLSSDHPLKALRY